MSDDLKEFLRELHENWNDHYWWTRHLGLQVAMLSIISGLIGLLFCWLETRIKKASLKGAV